MKDFCEAILNLNVKPGMAQVYKKAIESENANTRWQRNTIIDVMGTIKSDEIEPVWNGVYAHVSIDGLTLTISLLSHTAKSLKQVVEWYERVGCKVIYQNYREETK
ncbi:hypothetical protein [Enterococcus asini]|uniref:hypothetical protein n=1 Tax=Enterococcus asini TaxID=57732 RepID=UPI0026DB6439|nr:hypothetical protein [Enterococcus asini]